MNWNKKYKYANTKSRLNGQVYSFHTVDGRVYLTPVGGTATKQVKMDYISFMRAVKNEVYILL